MYNINRDISKEFRNAYTYQSINSFGQILKLDIYESNDSPLDHIHYCVTFHITSKKRLGFQSLKTTGKDGIKSLLWAKSCIIDFIEHMNMVDIKYGHITVFWDDSKRKRIYCYWLKNIGFNLGRINNKECLIYKSRGLVK